MIVNQIKLERADIFVKYIASVSPLVFPPKTLIWNKIVLPVSNSLKVWTRQFLLGKSLTILFFASDFIGA